MLASRRATVCGAADNPELVEAECLVLCRIEGGNLDVLASGCVMRTLASACASFSIVSRSDCWS
jgi:hypothetical protein